jgi:hypothetical protein
MFCWAPYHDRKSDYALCMVLTRLLVYLKRFVSKESTLDVRGDYKKCDHYNTCPGRLLRELCGSTDHSANPTRDAAKKATKELVEKPAKKAAKKVGETAIGDVAQNTVQKGAEESDDQGSESSHAAHDCDDGDGDDQDSDDQDPPGGLGSVPDSSPEHGFPVGTASLADNRSAAGDARDFLLEPAEAAGVQETPTTIERALVTARILMDPDGHISRMRAGSNKLTGLRLPVDALKRRSPAPEESHRQGKRSKTDQTPSNDINGMDPIHSCQENEISPEQRFSYVYGSQDEPASDMSDGPCSQFVQNHEEDPFASGRHNTAPDQSISGFRAGIIPGGLPAISTSQSRSSFDADVFTGSHSSGAASQFEPYMEPGALTSCHDAGSFEMPPSGRGFSDDLYDQTSEEHATLAIISLIKHSTRLREWTMACSTVLGTRALMMLSTTRISHRHLL